MRVRRLIFVGLLVSALLLPWTSASAAPESQDEPVWTGWIDSVVQWVAAIVTTEDGGTDTEDGGTVTFTLDPADTSQLHSQPSDDSERRVSIDPDS